MSLSAPGLFMTMPAIHFLLMAPVAAQATLPARLAQLSEAAPVRVEQACLSEASLRGYRIYSRTNPGKAGSFYFMNMEGVNDQGKRYSATCRYNRATNTATLESIKALSDSNTTDGYPEGYSATMFFGIPGYESGLRVKNTGYEDASPKRRNFLVKNDVSMIDFRWYADCTTPDQIYDGQKYLGYDPDARALMAYACALGQDTQPRPR